jgi:hypothetical protein
LDKLIAQTAADSAKPAAPSIPGLGADLPIPLDAQRDTRSRDPIDLRSREGR